MSDLRTTYDECDYIKYGILYLKDNIIQIWCYDEESGDTWILPNVEEAKRNYQDMKERFTNE